MNVAKFRAWARTSVEAVRGRPIVGDPAIAAWLVLASALPYGIQDYRVFFNINILPLGWRPTAMAGLNFRSYYVAAEAARAGHDFYAVYPEGWSAAYTYQYPPVTVVGFFPFTVVDWWTGYLVFLGLMVIASVVGTVLLVGFIERQGRVLGWIDVLLIFVFFVGSTHTMGSVYFGNINLFLATALIIGFVGWYRGWETTAGAVFGMAALFKVIPAIIGIWLLRVRSWRAVGAAVATGVGGLGMGVLLFGVHQTAYFFTDVLLGRAGSTRFIGGYPPSGLYYVTIQRPLSYLIWEIFPAADPSWLILISVIIGGILLGYFLADLSTRMDLLIAIFATVTLLIVIFPSYRLYLVLLYFPFISLLYLWEGPGQRLFAIGGIMMSYTFRPGDIIEQLSVYPDFIQSLLVPVATVASVQLYGLFIMLIGCAVYKHHAGTGGWMSIWRKIGVHRQLPLRIKLGDR